jgi:hypothetical protein
LRPGARDLGAIGGKAALEAAADRGEFELHFVCVDGNGRDRNLRVLIDAVQNRREFAIGLRDIERETQCHSSVHVEPAEPGANQALAGNRGWSRDGGRGRRIRGLHARARRHGKQRAAQCAANCGTEFLFRVLHDASLLDV